MLHSWAIYNGIELANNVRVLTYLQNGYGGSSMTVRPDCPCQTAMLLGPEEYHPPYENPVLDEAPWWCEEEPFSDEFAGFYLENVTGFDSPIADRSIAQNVGRGGSLGPIRHQPRRLRFSGWLYGRTCAGVEYGLDWLNSVVTGKTCRAQNLDVCGLGQLTMAAFCVDNDPSYCGPGEDGEFLPAVTDPDDPAPAYLLVGDTTEIQGGNRWQSIARTMCNVGITQGIKVVEKRGRCCSSCGCTQYKVEFELTAENPFMHEPIQWCWGREQGLRFGNEIYPIEFFCCEQQAEVTDSLLSANPSIITSFLNNNTNPQTPFQFCLTNYLPSCGFIEPPPPPKITDRCFCEPWGTRRRCCKIENPSKTNTDDLVFKIINESEDEYARNLRISIYEWDGLSLDLHGDIDPDLFVEPDCPGCEQGGIDPEDEEYVPLTIGWECCATVTSFEILEVAPQSTLEINGACRRINLDWLGHLPVNGSRLVSGDQNRPFKFPELKPCTRICVVAYADCDNSPQQLRFAAGRQPRHEVSC